MRTITLLTLFLSTVIPLAAEETMDTWVMTDGRMFQAALMQAAPGKLKVRLTDGKEEVLEISELSELSKKRAAERLGLGAAAGAAAATTPAPEPAAPPPSPPVSAEGSSKMSALALPEGVIALTDAGAIEAAMGTEIAAAGIVKEVATLGSAGHRKILFEGTPVVAFIGKWDLEKSGDWKFDGLEGKTLQVSGKVGKYNDELQIQPASPNGMQVLAAD